jgi:hypothetical protein
MDDFEHPVRSGCGAIMIWGLAFILLLVIGTVIFTALRPAQVYFNTKVNQSSQGYVESKQSLLLKLVEDYHDLDVKIAELGSSDSDKEIERGLHGQQQAIIDRVREEANLLNPSDVPKSVRAFLAEHPSH